jgi:hypothetical protein
MGFLITTRVLWVLLLAYLEYGSLIGRLRLPLILVEAFLGMFIKINLLLRKHKSNRGKFSGNHS